ncbi:circularly permuted type 2 ATP-grasp protein [Olsenella profusa]|uniref:circularly permuted type 2 ATP-grasp protein n=1 Tax=Olsenella profusa TaxID=138595 RepID=UPI00315A87C3
MRFGVYKDGEYHDRLFPYDPIPRIIASDEYDRLKAGLRQRVDALNAYLRDVYSDKRIVHDGVVPEEFVYTSPGYLPQVNGVTPPAGIFAHIAGEDLVQGADGRWWVLEDNLRIPSGASYPLFVRDIERHTDPRLFRDHSIRDNRDYPRLLRKTMDFVSTQGIAVILSPGRYNSAFSEHAYLAEKTGATLAFPDDLEVVDNQVFLRDYAGRHHRVGVVYRRLSDEYLDPFAFNPDSLIGVPGILAAYRAGNVAIVNAPGNGAAEDKGIYYFVPEMVRYYLHEEPILQNAPTYLPFFEKDRREALSRLGELVIKDVSEAGGYGVVFGSSLGATERAERIEAEPRRFIAQEVIDFRDIDVVDPASGERVPRKCDLRAFVLTGKHTHVWYSGLTRCSFVEGQMIVNSSQGGGFKDTWVLSPEDDAQAAAAPAGGTPGSGATPGEKDVEKDARAADRSESATPSLFPEESLRTRPHALSLVTASKSENLYWLGRYTERVYTTLAFFYPYCDRMLDAGPEAFRPLAHALDLPEDFEDVDAFVHSLLYDTGNPGSVSSALTAAFNNATILRPELGTRLLQYLELAMANLDEAIRLSPAAGDFFDHRNIADDLLAFWGGIENSPADPAFKALLLLGKYIERIDLYTRFSLPADLLDAPLRKLASYSTALARAPLPECVAAGMRLLAEELPGRGYPTADDRLCEILASPSGAGAPTA